MHTRSPASPAPNKGPSEPRNILFKEQRVQLLTKAPTRSHNIQLTDDDSPFVLGYCYTNPSIACNSLLLHFPIADSNFLHFCLIHAQYYIIKTSQHFQLGTINNYRPLKYDYTTLKPVLDNYLHGQLERKK